MKSSKTIPGAHGGAREGGGRKAGIATTRTREIAEAALASGLTPVEYMLSVMRDEGNDTPQRLDAAKSAAPYIHPRLSTIDATLKADITATVTELRRTIVDSRNPDA